ncbi:hypothetical protein [Parapedobacter tibetensis]|uniref:hypothetical protein n=1 Tax=Parapedobacter tibetensis TaxID=2972951 RepID=UPI00214D67D4|nr:hypothetical protein [Parapedobacter tibetensis]
MKQSSFNTPQSGSLAASRKHDSLDKFLSRGKELFLKMLDDQLRRKFVTLSILFSAALFFMACSADNASQKAEEALQSEKDAILAVIEKETEAFFARDYESWKSNYVQEDYAFQAWSNKDGTFDSSVGWEGIDNSVGQYIHDNPEPVSSHPIVERKNIKFKFYGDNVAYLTWDQFNSDRENKLFFHSKEVRLLEKVSNEWKIVCVSAFWDFKNLIPAEKLKDIQRMDKESRGKDKI